MSEIQAILFNKFNYSADMARSWLNNHNYNPIKRVHVTHNYLRYRINEPEKYKSFRITKESDGIRFIIGFF